MTFQFLQIVLILKINGFTLLLEASTFLSTMNLSTMTKTVDYSFFHLLQVLVGQNHTFGEPKSVISKYLDKL